MDYSIGQVSKLLGLSIEGIRNYEKAGIIQSRRPEGSNYRKYSYLDITSLIRARLYRSLGYTIQETTRLTNESTLQDVCEALGRRKAELHYEIALAQQKLLRLEEMEKSIGILDAELGRVGIDHSPAIYRFEFSQNGMIDFSEDTVALFQKWADYAPFTFISSRYCDGIVYGGLAIEEKYAGLFDIHEDKRVKQHARSLSLRLTVMEEDNGYSDVSILKTLYDYADRHHFILSKDLIGCTVIGVNKASGYRRYRRIFARITGED